VVSERVEQTGNPEPESQGRLACSLTSDDHSW